MNIDNNYSLSKKKVNEYEIELSINVDGCLNILIKNDFYYYESNFNEKYLQQKLNSNESINNIYNNICDLIDKREIKIEKYQNNIKLIFEYNNLYGELIIEISLKNLFEKINKLNNFKKGDIIRRTIFIFIISLNIILFSLLITKNNKIKDIENNINKINKQINLLLNYNITNIFEKKIEEMNNKLEQLNKSIQNKYNYLTLANKYIDLKNIKKIDTSLEFISSLSIFPSGNILVLNYSIIKIYDINFNLLQQIEISNNSNIKLSYSDIYDENNFVTSSKDKSIIIWIKNKTNNQYQINKIINNAHNDSINKVIYTSKGNLISCSNDGLIKIWEINNGEYKNIQTLNHNNKINSLLLLEDKNILISSGNGIKFWNLTNNNIIFSIDNIFTYSKNGLEIIDENKIIVCNNTNLIVISISKLKIIKKIDIEHTYSIISIKNKEIFLVGGLYDIYIFKNFGYELIQIIENAHFFNVNGIYQLKNSLISFSFGKIIKTWSFY